MKLRFPTPMRCVALISGGGRTVLNLLDRQAKGDLNIEIPLAIANRDCSGIEKLKARDVPVEQIPRKGLPSAAAHSELIFQRIRDSRADAVLLAGYLARLVIPTDYEMRVINIHPALIPAFSGHGMYGEHVHAAVIERGCKVSGCTVHLCDNEYDHGPILVQHTVPVLESDTPDSLAARVFEAECEAFPEALRLLMSGPVLVENQRAVVTAQSTPHKSA